MITTIETRIDRKWLERKPKHELASIILANIYKIDLFAEESKHLIGVADDMARAAKLLGAELVKLRKDALLDGLLFGASEAIAAYEKIRDTVL